MASAPREDDVFDEFLAQRGHEVELPRWDESYNKKQCPECCALHDRSATECSVCSWSPVA